MDPACCCRGHRLSDRGILAVAGHPLPTTPAVRLIALKALLLERGAKTFPVHGFNRRPLAESPDPGTAPVIPESLIHP